MKIITVEQAIQAVKAGFNWLASLHNPTQDGYQIQAATGISGLYSFQDLKPGSILKTERFKHKQTFTPDNWEQIIPSLDEQLNQFRKFAEKYGTDPSPPHLNGEIIIEMTPLKERSDMDQQELIRLGMMQIDTMWFVVEPPFLKALFTTKVAESPKGINIQTLDIDPTIKFQAITDRFPNCPACRCQEEHEAEKQSQS